MAAIDPDRGPGEMAEPEVQAGPAAGTADPWGIRKAEKLLQSLQGVLSARLVASPLGDVTEVHVLTKAGTPPKQMVRNVESALLAHLGLKIDHRKISVAQTADVEPIEVLEKTAVREEARKRVILFRRVEVRHARGQRVTVRVTLDAGGEEVVAEEESADAAKSRVNAAARATVRALDQVIPSNPFELEGAIIVAAFQMEFAFIGVRVMEARQARVHTGSCEIKESAEQSAVLAVLDATNRWVQSYW